MPKLGIPKKWLQLQTLLPDVAWWAIILLGVVLRVRQYLADRSLWGDETSLAINIVTRSFKGLTEPLSYHQAAPLGFLFVEKLSIILFWNADYILRLFPLFAGSVSLYFMYRLARENFGVAGMFAMLMFALNPLMIFYSSEAKQYSTDVLAALMLVCLATRCSKENAQRKDFVFLGIVGMVIIWFSHISIFILAGIGITLMLEMLIRKKYEDLPWLFAVGALWLASFSADYYVALRQTAGDRYFITYWARRFVPLPPWSNPAWFVDTAYFFLFNITNRTDQILLRVVLLLALLGGVSLLIRKRYVLLMIALPFLITFIASALKSYPLTYRFMLFLVPYALLFMAEGIRVIYSTVARWRWGVALTVSLIPVVFFMMIAVPNAVQIFQVPQTISEIKPVIKYVAEKKQQHDLVYVYYVGVPGVRYYAPQYKWNLDPNLTIMGSLRQNEEKAYQKFLEDVDALVGRGRVWFIFNEITNCGECKSDKLIFVRDYIAQYGTLLDSFGSVQSAAYLFNMRE